MYSDENSGQILATLGVRSDIGQTLDLVGGGYWVGPTPGPDIPANITATEAERRAQEGFKRSPLFKFAIFHGNWSTFNFADGHAEGHKWIDSGTIKAAADSAKNIESYYWQGGNSSNPDFRWVWEHYRHQDWKALP